MLQIVERENYTSEIAVPPERWSGELGVTQLGRFASRGNFSFSQVAGGVSLHAVFGGSGTFVNRHGNFTARSGDLMFFFPGESYRYADDAGAPWRYFWVMFEGSRAVDLMQECGFCATAPWRGQGAWELRDPLDYWHRELCRSNWGPSASAAAWALLAPLRGGTAGNRVAPAEQIRRLIDQAVYAWPTVQELAEALELNRSTVYRVFQQQYGISVKEYIDRRRMKRALELLRNTTGSMDEIAGLCGFANRQYFARCFRAFTGSSPAVWREVTRQV